ncbi:flagellar protein FlaG [Thermovibrio sp.]
MDVKPVVNLQASLEINLQTYSAKNQPEKELFSLTHREKERKKGISPEVLESVLNDLKKKLSLLNTQLKIQIDKNTDIVVVKVIDKETQKVIRQIPPEYVLKIAKYLDEIAGLLFSEKV